MCVVSMVGDHYRDKWQDHPWISKLPMQPPARILPYPLPHDRTVVVNEAAEIAALRREVEEMKALLKRAKLYDEANNEPDCEVDEKMELLRRVAAAVGISLDDVVGAKA